MTSITVREPKSCDISSTEVMKSALFCFSFISLCGQFKTQRNKVSVNILFRGLQANDDNFRLSFQTNSPAVDNDCICHVSIIRLTARTRGFAFDHRVLWFLYYIPSPHDKSPTM